MLKEIEFFIFMKMRNFVYFSEISRNFDFAEVFPTKINIFTKICQNLMSSQYFHMLLTGFAFLCKLKVKLTFVNFCIFPQEFFAQNKKMIFAKMRTRKFSFNPTCRWAEEWGWAAEGAVCRDPGRGPQAGGDDPGGGGAAAVHRGQVPGHCRTG